jgi:phosphoglycolate phosphatase-like HAD superfamily hydrolase
MHLVVFDIDGTLTDTNLVDGECYWRAVREVLGLSGERPDWSDFHHVTDVGIAAELCARHLGRQLSSPEIEAIGSPTGGAARLFASARRSERSPYSGFGRNSHGSHQISEVCSCTGDGRLTGFGRT